MASKKRRKAARCEVCGRDIKDNGWRAGESDLCVDCDVAEYEAMMDMDAYECTLAEIEEAEEERLDANERERNERYSDAVGG